MEQLDQHRREVVATIEANKRNVKEQYDKGVHLLIFFEGDLVLVYDNDKLGARKFKPMWNGPYIVSDVLLKRGYELADYEGLLW